MNSAWVLVTAGSDASVLDGRAVATSRVSLAKGVGVRVVGDDGTITIAGPIAGGDVRASLHGFDDDVSIALVGSLELRDDGQLDPQPLLARGLTLIATSGPGDLDAEGSARVVYASTLEPSELIVVTTGGSADSFRSIERGFLARDQRVVILDDIHAGLTAIDGRAGADGAPLIVVQIMGELVELSGTVSADALREAAGTLRLADDAEWTGLLASIDREQEPTRPFLIGHGSLANGAGWRVDLTTPSGTWRPSVALTTSHEFDDVAVAEVPLDPDLPSIQSRATRSFTSVIAVAKADAAGAVLRVTVDGNTYDASVELVDHSRAEAAAVVAILEVGPFHADLIASDGTVITTLDG